MKNGEMTTYESSSGSAAPELPPTPGNAHKLKVLGTPNIGRVNGVAAK